MCSLYEDTFKFSYKTQPPQATPCANHSKEKEQHESYFQQLGKNPKRQRQDRTGVIYHKKKDVVKASYEVALLVAKHMMAYTIGESLVMPAAKILV